MEITPVRVIDQQRAQLIIVGVGGTGGYVIGQVARLLYGLKVERGRNNVPRVLLIDGDEIEQKNLLRQQFLPQDIGKKKASVLAERYSRAYGIDVAAYPSYITYETRLEELGAQRDNLIVVGCVDNGSTRLVLHNLLGKLRNVVYIDSGNSGVNMPQNPEHIDRYQLKKIKDSGWDGQVVAGVRVNGQTKLPFPGDVFPNLIEEDQLPTEVSCGEVVVSNPQRHMTNILAATSVLMYLYTLLSDGTILNSRTMFDALRGYVSSHPAISMLHEVSIA
ncbi:ThiF family adenylyltransferase [Alicyclobacillus fodiniaquatilis]|uniref:ThiF family adenylyltransferase n=1 Tax=Alicyclobacillus fodiniaquatilis TaxID=1661150 RepID=A0ABW4JIE7_9BACL